MSKSVGEVVNLFLAGRRGTARSAWTDGLRYFAHGTLVAWWVGTVVEGHVAREFVRMRLWKVEAPTFDTHRTRVRRAAEASNITIQMNLDPNGVGKGGRDIQAQGNPE